MKLRAAPAIASLSLLGSVLLVAACKVKDPPPIAGEPWTDRFERDDVGSNYYQTGDGYRLSGGSLSARGAHNKPLWLRKKLPRNVQIDVTAWSTSPDGDIKLELFGDGQSFDPDRGGYTSTGYVFIQGGWHNTKSIIARENEHGADQVARNAPRVTPGQKYHWRIVRQGAVVTWYVDDLQQPFLRYEDPRPLEGSGHEYLAFDNWESDSWFDDLVVTPL